MTSNVQTGVGGLYLHIPFCVAKCPYCDFYSVGGATPLQKDAYTDALISSMLPYAGSTFDTVYFGGGTPPLLGAANLCRVLEASRRLFVLSDPEVTLECNPETTTPDLLREVLSAGVNRISAGLQSADARELALLGRRHQAADAARLVETAYSLGCENLSLDLMAALPGQTPDTLRASVAFCAALPIAHISGYLLKVEPGTPFAKNGILPPDDDTAADLYLALCEACEQAGFRQYEISNFARPGRESRHNTKYWRLDPYLGLGPAAHSYWNGRRFFWPRDLDDFCTGALRTVDDGPGGSAEEYLMLGLRLTEGVDLGDLAGRYGVPSADVLRALAPYERAGLALRTERGFRLTRNGFLVSNGIIGALLDALDIRE